MAKHPEVPLDIVDHLRSICRALPEVSEERAWVGTRWTVRKKNFAHVLMIDGGKPAAYAEAAGSNGPLCVLTFRSPLPELDVHAYRWSPFFKPRWFPDIVGMALQVDTDWDEVAGVLVGSYRMLAPKKLADQLGLAPAAEPVSLAVEPFKRKPT